MTDAISRFPFEHRQKEVSCYENLVGSPCKRAVMPHFIATRKWWCYSFTCLPILASSFTAWSIFSTIGRALIPVKRPLTQPIIKSKGYAHTHTLTIYLSDGFFLFPSLSHTNTHSIHCLSPKVEWNKRWMGENWWNPIWKDKTTHSPFTIVPTVF